MKKGLQEQAGASGKRCMQTVRKLDGMGIRFAGTPGEQKAARWIQRRFEKLGLQRVHQEEFPCLTFSYEDCRLRARADSKWRKIKALPVAHSPSTPDGGVKASLVRIERVPEQLQACREAMEGRAVLILNSELFEWSRFQRVLQAEPALLLVVDDRFPNDWTVAVGLPRSWVDVVSCPMVNIAHQSAWDIVRQGCERVSLRLQTSVAEARSQNVVGEIRGRGLSSEVIVVSGHHDSVINNPGADDNATGVASVLELARVLSQGPRLKRTIRFISFGAEEQLSEGARHYVLGAPDRDKICFALNTDSIGGWMGKTVLYWAGPVAVERFLEEWNQRTGLNAHLSAELSPFSDHFPFNLAGIPSVWYYRLTYQAARHYHHSVLETPEVVSPEILEKTVQQQVEILKSLANADPLPFKPRIPAPQMKVLKGLAREWCGMDGLGALTVDG